MGEVENIGQKERKRKRFIKSALENIYNNDNNYNNNNYKDQENAIFLVLN